MTTVVSESFILAALIIIAIIIAGIALVISISNRLKLKTLLEYSDDGESSLVENFKHYYGMVSDIQKKINAGQLGTVNNKLTEYSAKVNNTLSKTAIVNFDAFDDVRGSQSFALAVLNQYNDGFVLTSIYGNSSSNTYVRKVINGKTETKLLPEEEKAIEQALNNG